MAPVDQRDRRALRADTRRVKPALAAGALALTACVAAPQTVPAAAAAAAPIAFLPRPAAPSRLAARSLMLDIARCGQRLLTVGERGRILLSDDAGQSWRQAKAVPVSVTLTAVQCADDSRGWAVGHAGVVLRTDDAGESWKLQLDGNAAARLALRAAEAQPADSKARRNAEQLVADGPDKPFLGLQFSSPTAGLVVGAYGLIFSTDDGGSSWRSRIADTDDPQGLHLNAVRRIGAQTWIAGERGLLLRADDNDVDGSGSGSGNGASGSTRASARFAAQKSPYDGSWFTLDAAPGGGVVLGGLRGNVFVAESNPRSADSIDAWRKVELPAAASVVASRAIDGGRLVLVAQDGAVYLLGADRKPARLALPPSAPPTAVVQAGDGFLVAATLRGALRLSAAAPAVAAASR